MASKGICFWSFCVVLNLSSAYWYLKILPACTFIRLCAFINIWEFHLPVRLLNRPCTFIRNTRVGAISIAFASPLGSKTIESGFEELNASVSEVFVNRTQSLWWEKPRLWSFSTICINPTIFNIIHWAARSLGRTTRGFLRQTIYDIY